MGTTKNEKNSFTGNCRHCGAGVMWQAKASKDTEEDATLNCTCAEAQKYQQHLKNAEKVKKSREQIKNFCEERGYKPTDKTLQLCIDGGQVVADQEISTYAIKIGAIQVSFKLNNDGGIVLTLKFTHSQKEEL